jgi:hypothetical protein
VLARLVEREAVDGQERPVLAVRWREAFQEVEPRGAGVGVAHRPGRDEQPAPLHHEDVARVPREVLLEEREGVPAVARHHRRDDGGTALLAGRGARRQGDGARRALPCGREVAGDESLDDRLRGGGEGELGVGAERPPQRLVDAAGGRQRAVEEVGVVGRRRGRGGRQREAVAVGEGHARQHTADGAV